MTQQIYDPGQPYLLPIPGGFSPGRIAHLTGTFSPSATSLVLKFQSGPYGDPTDEIGLCLYARLNEGILGMNAFIRTTGWGQEEVVPCHALSRGQTFEITILCDPYTFKLAVNGQHMKEFAHRLNPASLTHMNVASNSSDLTVSCIWIEDSAQPMPGPAPPYSAVGGVPPSPYGPPPIGQQNYAPQNAGYAGQPHHGGKNKGLLGMVGSAGAAVAGALGASSLLGKSKGYPSHGGGYSGGQASYGNYPGYQGQPPPPPQYGNYPGSQPQYGNYPGGPPQYQGYPTSHKSGGGGILNKAMAVGGGILGAKAMSKGVGGLGGLGGNKAMKYGLPIAGAGLGGYMLSKGMKKSFSFGDSFECCSDSD